MPPSPHSIADSHRIGIDLGGTKIEGIVLAPDGTEGIRRRIATRQEEGYEAILARVTSLISELSASIGPHAPTIGVGIPGTISARTGLVKNANTVCLIGRPLQADLEGHLGRPVGLMNDANCFAMAEALRGAGRGYPMVFGVIMGTGCGGGIVYQGEVIEGRQRIAGEWGHMVLDPAGPACYCGARGCVETFISGGGLEARYADVSGECLPVPEIVAREKAGDPRAVRCMQAFYEHFGQAMANLIAVLDPDIVILGGGVSNLPELYTRGVAEVARRVFNDALETPIVPHTLGDSAGVFGAALIGV